MTKNALSTAGTFGATVNGTSSTDEPPKTFN